MRASAALAPCAALGLLYASSLLAAAPSRPRARDLGVPFDGTPGPLNAITDVAGIEVGHSTIVSGEGRLEIGRGPVRTGVTAIVPRGRASFEPVFAGWFSLNGDGEMTGTTWVEDSGFLKGPVMITNTISVGTVRDAVIAWRLSRGQPPHEYRWSLPVVAETWDGYLNDIYGFHVRDRHVFEALDGARSGAVAEGSVGGGTGMICHEFKGGIGTASRRTAQKDGGHTLGVLVQCNYGLRRQLRVAGVPVGQHIPEQPVWSSEEGSIIVVIATDAPLLPHQLKRLARRSTLGLARTGSASGNGSGDLFIAFSTANPGAGDLSSPVTLASWPNDLMTPLFEATVQATEEAIVNALVAAETMVGADAHRVVALPHDRLRQILKEHNRMGPTAERGLAASPAAEGAPEPPAARARPAKPRARDLGVPFEGSPGPLNAITDVRGVEVGHSTLISGQGELVVGSGPVRTGVTAILPRGRRSTDPVFAGWFSLNGNGEMTGTTWVEESGFLEGPVMLTNTHSVGVVRDAVVAWRVRHGRPAGSEYWWSLPVVAETYDGYLNDINGFHVKQRHAFEALDGARSGPVTEGNAGGGTGMICHEFKGGIGTASRQLERARGGHTVGVLVQCNYGTRRLLRIAGAPVGEEIPENPVWPEETGSIIIVVATDAPLLPHQLERVARRAALGLGRNGSVAGNSSGDIFIAFSTANPGAADPRPGAKARMLPNEKLDPLFEATVQATEEAVVNALVAAETMRGADGRTVVALPHQRLREVLEKYNRLGR